MPYLPVELDAIHKFDDAAGAAGLPAGDIYRGMLRLWASVFRSGRPTVSVVQLRGFFPGAPEIGQVLEAFDFLEHTGPAEYRVRGSSRLLAKKAGQSAGGHASKGNLNRGSKPGVKPGPSREQAGEEGPASPGSTPNTQHPTPNTVQETTLSTEVDPEAPQLELVPPEPKRRATDQAQEVFAHWRTASGRGGQTVFSPKRQRVVLARLADGFDVEALKRAVDGCLKTPHNRGENDRGEKYDDLELICRDVEHVERFIRNAQAPPRPKHKAGRAEPSDWSIPQEVDESGNVIIPM